MRRVPGLMLCGFAVFAVTRVRGDVAVSDIIPGLHGINAVKGDFFAVPKRTDVEVF